jgi:hypothetical protein
MRFQQLLTVDVFRRGHGRRYSLLPVDQLDREGFVIDCGVGGLRPEHFDLRQGDIVRFAQGERYVEATIASVSRDSQHLRAVLVDALLLPPEYFPF